MKFVPEKVFDAESVGNRNDPIRKRFFYHAEYEIYVFSRNIILSNANADSIPSNWPETVQFCRHQIATTLVKSALSAPSGILHTKFAVEISLAERNRLYYEEHYVIIHVDTRMNSTRIPTSGSLLHLP